MKSKLTLFIAWVICNISACDSRTKKSAGSSSAAVKCPPGQTLDSQTNTCKAPSAGGVAAVGAQRTATPPVTQQPAPGPSPTPATGTPAETEAARVREAEKAAEAKRQAELVAKKAANPTSTTANEVTITIQPVLVDPK